MQFPSGLAASPAIETVAAQNRVHYRHPIQSLVYVRLDEGNGGIIRNLSQGGAAIQAVGALHVGQLLRMRFDLLNPKTRMDLHAEVHWANPSGQAGVRFLDVSPQSTRQLNDWIFMNLMRGIEHASAVLPTGFAGDDLILSVNARPAISLPRQAGSISISNAISLPWWPGTVSQRSLSRLLDGLVMLSAVLAFFCVFLSITQTLPTWPVAIAVAAGVSGFFTALYWCLCSFMGCGTAGAQLAKIALGKVDIDSSRDIEARFR